MCGSHPPLLIKAALIFSNDMKAEEKNRCPALAMPSARLLRNRCSEWE
jgi:hypothetical protein